ncbi:HNH endonuclease [Demequina rhizosphaerae]|uniref:HNH endonuclease n=1 Tax=Demequina rhizosphaerae TaxID=1638985 RepID=UPI000ACBF8CC|nr:HNH endonuclease [Demequina rhizosphaerae]
MVEDSEVVRARIFHDVMQASDEGTKPLHRDWLLNYSIDGERLPLIDPQGRGIRNPADWSRTLSITTVENGRYPDREVQPGVWQYPFCVNKHGAVDASNNKLFAAQRDGVPVLYFYKPMAYTYLPVGMVAAVARDDSAREFTIALTEGRVHANEFASPIEREWAQAVVERRLHQPRFRAIVMSAYGSRCAICALPDAALLDAAHIRADKDPNGQPVVENGLALCSIHHRAYDHKHLGIDEDLRLHVRSDVLAITDGPVWEHALQRLPGQSLAVVPRSLRDRPDPYRLGLTFKEFLAGA